VAWSPGATWFNLEPGKEHYRLLHYLSKQLPEGCVIADCGTLFGCSAVALAATENIVITYDIENHLMSRCGQSNSILNLLNVVPRLGNCMNFIEEISSAAIVVLDIDPHDGVQEAKLFRSLVANDFRGILICDDIHLNQEMDEFWSKIEPIQNH